MTAKYFGQEFKAGNASYQNAPSCLSMNLKASLSTNANAVGVYGREMAKTILFLCLKLLNHGMAQARGSG
ncbi:hypothetical protein AAKU55_005559 [Oxalobacteraceae bacterium GrIS 1.11]